MHFCDLKIEVFASLLTVIHAIDHCRLKTPACSLGSVVVWQSDSRVSVHLMQIQIYREFNCAVLVVMHDKFQRWSTRNEVLNGKLYFIFSTVY